MLQDTGFHNRILQVGDVATEREDVDVEDGVPGDIFVFLAVSEDLLVVCPDVKALEDFNVLIRQMKDLGSVLLNDMVGRLCSWLNFRGCTVLKNSMEEGGAVEDLVLVNLEMLRVLADLDMNDVAEEGAVVVC